MLPAGREFDTCLFGHIALLAAAGPASSAGAPEVQTG